MCFEFTRGVAKDMGYQMSIVIVWLKCGGGEKNNTGVLLQGQNYSRTMAFCFEYGHAASMNEYRHCFADGLN